MSAPAAPLAAPRSVPSVPRQVLRATVGTRVVALVVGLAVGAWSTWGTAISARVFSVVGDPRVGTADGVALPTAPRTVAVPLLSAVALTPATEVAVIARGTGAPVSRLDACALEKLAPRVFGDGATAASLAEGMHYYATPLGVVQITSPVPDDAEPGFATEHMVILRVPNQAVRQLSPAGQEALLRRLVTAWGVGDGAAAFGAHVDVRSQEGPNGIVGRLWMPGTDAPCSSCAPGVVLRAPDGTLDWLSVGAEHIVGTEGAQVESAAAAFDALRHHADGTYLTIDSLGDSLGAGGTAPGPVATASLVIEADMSASTMPARSVLIWQFADAEGNLVGTVVAGSRSS
jgi:hypothetical protein